MKHLRQYEQLDYNDNPEYKIGDYLKITPGNYRLNPYPIIAIIDHGDDLNTFTIAIVNMTKNKEMFSSIKKNSEIIERKATEEEIKEFRELLELIENTDKYNI